MLGKLEHIDDYPAMYRASLLILFLACGSEDNKSGVDAANEPDAISDIDAPLSQCAQATSDLAALMSLEQDYCHIVLRYEYETRAPIAYQVLCAAPNKVDEKQALADVKASVMFMDGAKSLHNEQSPKSIFAFYRSPGDFGGAALVSRHTGEIIFGGTIIWSGTGDIQAQKSWRPYEELAPGCGTTEALQPRWGYDFLSGSILARGLMDQLAMMPEDTVIKSVIDNEGVLLDVTSVLYPRSVGAFNPKSAEYVVVISASPALTN